MAKFASLVTSLTYPSTFSPTYSSRNDLDPRAALVALYGDVNSSVSKHLHGNLFSFLFDDQPTFLDNPTGHHSPIVHPTISSRLAGNHFQLRLQQTNTVLLRFRLACRDISG